MDIRVDGNGSQSGRVVPLHRNRLRFVLDRAPQVAQFAESKATEVLPTVQRVYGIRRRIATVAIALFTAWLFVHVMFGANGMVVYRQKRAEYQSLQKELGDLQKQNALSTRQIDDLRSDPKAIEKIAREQFHYTKAGEFVLVRPTPVVAPTIPDTHAAQK